jgi:hypothetical protein
MEKANRFSFVNRDTKIDERTLDRFASLMSVISFVTSSVLETASIPSDGVSPKRKSRNNWRERKKEKVNQKKGGLSLYLFY